MNEKKVELEVSHLYKTFPVGKKSQLKAVEDVSFCVYEGETLGIVGESGCGKTTCGKVCMGMLDKSSGEALFRGQDVHNMTKKERFDFTQKVQMIFQDPYASLDSHQKVYEIVAEGIRIHKLAADKEQEREKVYELLEQVGLNRECAGRNVHEFSGGQRQRIGIARALSVNPEFLVCDEPVSALDVSVQAQIVNLLRRLQRERKLTMMFIAHDLAIVKYISDRVAVMYLGKLVELCDSEELYRNPMHPYTKALLSAIPVADPKTAKNRKRVTLEGEVPSPVDPPKSTQILQQMSILYRYLQREKSGFTGRRRRTSGGMSFM